LDAEGRSETLKFKEEEWEVDVGENDGGVVDD
jgi:hypothetical protein